MPPVDPTVTLTPWWVNFAVRLADIMEQKLSTNTLRLTPKDKQRLQTAITKCVNLVEQHQEKFNVD